MEQADELADQAGTTVTLGRAAANALDALGRQGQPVAATLLDSALATALRDLSAKIDETAALEVQHERRLTDLAEDLKAKKDETREQKAQGKNPELDSKDDAREQPKDPEPGNPKAQRPGINEPQENSAPTSSQRKPEKEKPSEEQRPAQQPESEQPRPRNNAGPNCDASDGKSGKNC